jgi:hypothetical protein
MLSFLRPCNLLTRVGIYSAFQFVRALIEQTHSDPYLKLVSDAECDLYFSFQVLHLVASDPYMGLLEYIMAGYATHIVSDRRHLLAMDLSVDYRGNSTTTQKFNYDAYEVSCLFHKKRVPVELFKPFVRWEVRSRREAYSAMCYLKTCRDFGAARRLAGPKCAAPAKAVRGARPARKEVVDHKCNSLLEVFKMVPDHVMRTKAKTVVTLVAVAQDYELLDAVLRRFREVRKDNAMEPVLLRKFLVGPHMGDGRGRLWLDPTMKATPLQALRRLMN